MDRNHNSMITEHFFCIILLIVCYALVLTELSYFSHILHWDPAELVADDGLKIYIIRGTVALLMGLLVAASLQAHRRKETILTCLTAGILLIIWGLSDFQREPLQKLLLIVWPVLMWHLANKIVTRMIRRGRRHSLVYFSAYYVIVLAAATSISWCRAPWLRFEPIQNICLILSAHIALWSNFLGEDYRTEINALEMFPNYFRIAENLRRALLALSHRNQQMRVWRTRCAVGASVFAAVLFFTQERGQAFLSGRRPLGEWLLYRCKVFLGNLKSDYSNVDVHFQDLVLVKCPLSRIYAVGGIFAALSVITLVLLAFLLMFAILKSLPSNYQYKSLCSTLVYTLAIRSALGFFADIFLVTTTHVHVLLLNQPWDLFPLILLTYLALQAPEERPELPDTIKLPWSGVNEVSFDGADGIPDARKEL